MQITTHLLVRDCAILDVRGGGAVPVTRSLILMPAFVSCNGKILESFTCKRDEQIPQVQREMRGTWSYWMSNTHDTLMPPEDLSWKQLLTAYERHFLCIVLITHHSGETIIWAYHRVTGIWQKRGEQELFKWSWWVHLGIYVHEYHV